MMKLCQTVAIELLFISLKNCEHSCNNIDFMKVVHELLALPSYITKITLPTTKIKYTAYENKLRFCLQVSISDTKHTTKFLIL